MQQTCGEVQQTEVGVDYSLMGDGKEADVGQVGLAAAGLYLTQQQDYLHTIISLKAGNGVGLGGGEGGG